MPASGDSGRTCFSLQGFEYQARSGQCCGLCVQVACVMNTSDSSSHLFYVSSGHRASGASGPRGRSWVGCAPGRRGSGPEGPPPWAQQGAEWAGSWPTGAPGELSLQGMLLAEARGPRGSCRLGTSTQRQYWPRGGRWLGEGTHLPPGLLAAWRVLVRPWEPLCDTRVREAPGRARGGDHEAGVPPTQLSRGESGGPGVPPRPGWTGVGSCGQPVGCRSPAAGAAVHSC